MYKVVFGPELNSSQSYTNKQWNFICKKGGYAKLGLLLSSLTAFYAQAETPVDRQPSDCLLTQWPLTCVLLFEKDSPLITLTYARTMCFLPRLCVDLYDVQKANLWQALVSFSQ